MKKTTFTIFALLFGSISFVKAQALDTIPNGDFERWKTTSNPSKEIPQGWDTLGGISYPVTEVDYPNPDGTSIVRRPVYDGKYALSLASQVITQTSLRLGIVECKFPMKYKDPWLDMNLAYMEGKALQIPAFTIIVWNSKSHDTLIKRIVAFSPTKNWPNDTVVPWNGFSIPLIYNADTTTPDSGIIILQNAVAGQGVAFPAASVLYVEKIWFDNAQALGITAEANLKNDASVYPNPFTNKTTIHYNLTQAGEVNLTVFDMQGREVKTLVNGNQSSGAYNEVFNANGLSRGVYMYRLQTSEGVKMGKLILAR